MPGPNCHGNWCVHTLVYVMNIICGCKVLMHTTLQEENLFTDYEYQYVVCEGSSVCAL